MVVVGARLHVEADDAAEAVAVLRVDAVLGDRDLFHRVDRRRVGRLVAGAERHAVEQHVVGAAGAAAGVVVVGVGVVVGPVLVGRGRYQHGGIERRQVVRVAAADRRLIDQRPIDVQLGGGGVEPDARRRGRFDRHGLLDEADRHGDVGGDVTALLDADVRQLRLLEALELGGDGVRPGLDEVEQIAALAVARAIDRHAGGDVGQLDRHAGQRGLARVHDPALHARAIVLRVRRSRSQPQSGDHGNQCCKNSHDLSLSAAHPAAVDDENVPVDVIRCW